MSENEPITVSADNYFAAIPYWVLEAGLSSSAVHLYAVLLRFANWTSKQGYPSRQRLATCMKVSIKTVDRAKDELLAAGVLIYERRHNKSNHYTVLTSRDKNDTTKGGRDKNDISRGDKNDTLTRVINNNKTPADKSATQKLVSLYLENLPLTSLKPSGKQIGGQIQQLLKTNTVEVLTLLIPIVAKDAKPLSTGTLMIAQTQLPDKTPTQIPPRYNPLETELLRTQSVPMPDHIKALRGAIKADLGVS